MAGFRQSKAFADWRSLVGPHFANPPRVERGETEKRGSSQPRIPLRGSFHAHDPQIGGPVMSFETDSQARNGFSCVNRRPNGALTQF